jgi:uncharacterized MAPEG superfamily protein
MSGSGRAEYLLLGIVVAWGLVQLFWAAGLARRQHGLDWATGSRDEPRPVSGGAARLERACRNFNETFPMFAAALLVSGATGHFGTLSLWGAHLYTWARIAYTPLYLSEIKGIRSMVWGTSIIGLVLVVVSIFV